MFSLHCFGAAVDLQVMLETEREETKEREREKKRQDQAEKLRREERQLRQRLFGKNGQCLIGA